jgi:hypothetical protein
MAAGQPKSVFENYRSLGLSLICVNTSFFDDNEAACTT